MKTYKGYLIVTQKDGSLEMRKIGKPPLPLTAYSFDEAKELIDEHLALSEYV